MGGFHIAMAFVGVIGKRFKDAGLKDLAVKLTAFAELVYSDIFMVRILQKRFRYPANTVNTRCFQSSKTFRRGKFSSTNQNFDTFPKFRQNLQK